MISDPFPPGKKKSEMSLLLLAPHSSRWEELLLRTSHSLVAEPRDTDLRWELLPGGWVYKAGRSYPGHWGTNAISGFTHQQTLCVTILTCRARHADWYNGMTVMGVTNHFIMGVTNTLCLAVRPLLQEGLHAWCCKSHPKFMVMGVTDHMMGPITK